MGSIINNPLYLGAGFGVVSNVVIWGRLSSALNQPKSALIEPGIVGGVGGAIGGFVASKMIVGPSWMMVVGCAVIGVLGANYLKYGFISIGMK